MVFLEVNGWLWKPTVSNRNDRPFSNTVILTSQRQEIKYTSKLAVVVNKMKQWHSENSLFLEKLGEHMELISLHGCTGGYINYAVPGRETLESAEKTLGTIHTKKAGKTLQTEPRTLANGELTNT